MKLCLQLIRSADQAESVPLENRPMFVGRADDCDLQIPDKKVSRYHCEIVRQADQLIARDLGSKNGTFINGRRLFGPKALRPGDRLEIGPWCFQATKVPQLSAEHSPPVYSFDEMATRLQHDLITEDDVVAWIQEQN